MELLSIIMLFVILACLVLVILKRRKRACCKDDKNIKIIKEVEFNYAYCVSCGRWEYVEKSK